MWLDEANKSAEFEPVGTHPGYRRRGLARAMILHGMQLGREQAAPPYMTVVCQGAPGHPAARELYYGLGFRRDSPATRRSSSAQADRAAVTVKRVLVTGMSGAGKSSLLDELAARGHRTVDTDYGDYFHTVDGESLWREDRISALLSSAPDELPGVLFVQGTTRNQVLFLPSVRPHRAAQRAARDPGRTAGRPRRQPLREGPAELAGDAERILKTTSRRWNRCCAPRPRSK